MNILVQNDTKQSLVFYYEAKNTNKLEEKAEKLTKKGQKRQYNKFDKIKKALLPRFFRVN